MIGRNVIKFLMRKLKNNDDYCRLISVCNSSSSPECKQFLDLIGSTPCRLIGLGRGAPEKVATVKLNSKSLFSRCKSTAFGVSYPTIFPCHREAP